MEPLELIYSKASETVQSSLVAVYNMLPNIFLAIIILVVGIFVAKFLRKATIKLLQRFGMARVTATSGFDSMLKRASYKGTAVTLIGDLVKILVYLITLAMIAEVLNIQTLVLIFQQIGIFLPRLIAAIIIVIVGAVVTGMVSTSVKVMLTMRTDRQRDKNIVSLSDILANLVEVVLYLVIIIIALNILGLSSIILDATYIIAVLCMFVVFVIAIKDIIPNFSAGINLQKRYNEGDFITILGRSGKITSIDALFTTLESEGKHIIIPNNILLKEIVEKAST
ncbi:MAG: mechanosensitive ion channel domain-containing protein [Candidatus Aenigmatarchaeota archaeon]